MSDEPNQTQPNEPDIKKKSPAFALMMAFVPSILVLIIFSFFSGPGISSPDYFVEISIFFGLISLACCFASSFMLFSSKKGIAIGAALTFLVLNICISLYFGCLAIINTTGS